MPNVSYNTRCLDCTKLNKTTAVIYVNELDEKYTSMTEYEFSFKLDEWMNDVEAYCRFCRSTNVYGEYIELRDKPLYDYDALVEKLDNSYRFENLLILRVSKSDGQLKVEVGGNKINHDDFLLDAWMLINDEYKKIPFFRYNTSAKIGEFFIVLSGIKGDITIHRMRMFGFERNHLENEIQKYFLGLNLI
jgi:hypothetical protein